MEEKVMEGENGKKGERGWKNKVRRKGRGMERERQTGKHTHTHT